MSERITVRIDEQTAADLAQMARRMRQHAELPEDVEFDSRLRDVQMTLEGALRSVGWTPSEHGWVKQMRPRGHRR